MLFGAIAAAALFATVTPKVQAAGPAANAFGRLIFHGTTSPRGRTAAPSDATQPSPGTADALVRQSKRGNRAVDVRPGAVSRGANGAGSNIPSANGYAVAGPDAGFAGFAGLTHFDQRTAGSGAYANTQFSLEPPDQGLCVGNGYVVEAVNNALAIYTTNGSLQAGPTAFSQFFGLAPEFVRPSGPFGPFVSDPRCRFDRDTQRWFITELEIDTDPATGNFGNHSSVLVAVSQSADPTGAYSVLSFDTTDAANPNCPCFGDQPLIGADAYGFYISTNEFPLAVAGFNGAQIYALSKRALVAGKLPALVHIDTGRLATPDAGGIWYSIQPASSPTTNEGGFRTGAEFFLSALDFNNAGVVGATSDNRVAVWALTNTQSLETGAPKLTLQDVVVPSVTYGQPPNAGQKQGPTPLGDSLHAPLETLQSNDDRMNQVVFAAGKLWGAVNTAVNVGGTVQSGIAYIAAAPSFAGNALHATTVASGYIAVQHANLLYPSIGVNAAGNAVLACSLSGAQFFPSAVYHRFGESVVRLAGAGSAPEDGFTGYAAYGGNGAARWGDYSAATTDEFGSIWFAAENAVASPRTALANWSTFIGNVR